MLPANDLGYLLTARLEDLREESSNLGNILRGQLRLASSHEDDRRMGIILCAMTSLGCRDDSHYASSTATDVAYRQACGANNWRSAAGFMITKRRETANFAHGGKILWIVTRLRELIGKEMEHGKQDQEEMSDQSFQQMLQSKYHEMTRNISLASYGGCCDDEDAFRQAVEQRHLQVAAIFHRFAEFKADSFFIILESADVSMCSDFLLSIPAWQSFLKDVRDENDMGDLAIMIHQSPLAFVWSEGHFGAGGEGDMYRQVCMRILSYHAIAKNDCTLFKCLLHSGMNMDELCRSWRDREVVEKTENMHGSFPQLPPGEDGHIILPSLLSVVAGQSNLTWIENLRDKGANMRDSMALLRAVKVGADLKTISRLLQAAKSQHHSANDSYGSAALRQALRSGRLDIAAMIVLCKAVNMDAVELSTEEWLDRAKPVTPLGEAILSDDLDVARWLLEHGADPSAYIAAFGTLHMTDRSSFLPLVTPLLAAVNQHNLPMVRLLVNFGAMVEDTRRSGLTRTPLQRAAELGQFNIVKYFIDRKARVDTIPTYSGGTALQLAAMNGHVGIAALLLEKGADPNHAPAKGDGRTAFEAAVEWGRVDMVSLLMRSGVDIDLCVGNPLEAQYERARRFAEGNGKFASKRNVERIYAQVQAHERRSETTVSTPQITPVEEIWSPGPMHEPIW